MAFQIQKRDLTGKKVKNLRNDGSIPGSLYGPGMESVNVSIPAKEFAKTFADAGYSKLIEVELEGKKYNALVKEVQQNVVNDQFLSVSLYKVDMDKPITAEVPLHFVGESPAYKTNAGILVHSADNIVVHCLPKDLPAFIEIELSGLAKVGDSVVIGDLKLPNGVTLDHSMNAETVLIYVAEPQKSIEQEEEEEKAKADAEAASAGEAPAEEAAAEEGEKKAE